MGDYFGMLVDADVAIDEARHVEAAMVAKLRELRLIEGDLNEDCVLGGEGYRSGPAVTELYKSLEQGNPFWTLWTSGVEPNVGRAFNEWAIGPSFEEFRCESCGAVIVEHAPLWECISHAIDEWLKQSGPYLVRCRSCGEERPITEWHAKPPLGFGNLSFTFWNWPRLDSPVRPIDIPGIFHQISGHRIVHTWGRI